MSHLIEPGQAAPNFSLHDQEARRRRLEDYLGRWVVLYFYPKDETPGCTTEACDFRDAMNELEAAGAEVLGVSPDSEKSHLKFAQKQALNFTLLADTDTDVCEDYGVWQDKTMYGKTYKGVVRTTYLVDPAGKVAHRWDKVRVPGHVEEVLAELRQRSMR